MRVNQPGGSGNQGSIVWCGSAVWKQRDIFQPRADAVSSPKRASVYCPACHTVSVMHLLEGNPGGEHYVLNRSSVVNGGGGVKVKRFYENAPAARRQARAYEGTRVIRGQQSSLDADSL